MNCLQAFPRKISIFQLNLDDLSDLDEKVGEAVGCYGKIDILVNSAGVHSVKSMTDFFNTTQEEFDKIMQVNLKGTYFVSQKIAKYFVENKIKGHILNISSSTGGEPGWSAYRISKQAIENLTLGLAQNLRSLIKRDAAIIEVMGRGADISHYGANGAEDSGKI